MRGIEPRYVTEGATAELSFSVCTLVASDAKYERMLASFARLGFDASNTEFIALDNRDANRFEGYGALRAVFPACRGEYVLFTHDDIELVDEGAEDLLDVLRDLEERDPLWTVAGNAGWSAGRPEWLALHLSDPHGTHRIEGGPVEVQSLDENFLVLPRQRMTFPSLDLEGYHLFGTDLCLQGRAAGGRAYVVPFFLHHHSGGSDSAAFRRGLDGFSTKYARLSLPSRIRAPATHVYLGAIGRAFQLIDTASQRVAGLWGRVSSRLAPDKKKLPPPAATNLKLPA
jgi:hypothetical protein